MSSRSMETLGSGRNLALLCEELDPEIPRGKHWFFAHTAGKSRTNPESGMLM